MNAHASSPGIRAFAPRPVLGSHEHSVGGLDLGGVRDHLHFVTAFGERVGLPIGARAHASLDGRKFSDDADPHGFLAGLFPPSLVIGSGPPPLQRPTAPDSPRTWRSIAGNRARTATGRSGEPHACAGDSGPAIFASLLRSPAGREVKSTRTTRARFELD